MHAFFKSRYNIQCVNRGTVNELPCSCKTTHTSNSEKKTLNGRNVVVQVDFTEDNIISVSLEPAQFTQFTVCA